MCVCVCVKERDRDRESLGEREAVNRSMMLGVCVCVSMCISVWYSKKCLLV